MSISSENRPRRLTYSPARTFKRGTLVSLVLTLSLALVGCPPPKVLAKYRTPQATEVAPTSTPIPPQSPTVTPTRTQTPIPTITKTPVPTRSDDTPIPTPTNPPKPTSTPARPTNTSVPPTKTPVPPSSTSAPTLTVQIKSLNSPLKAGQRASLIAQTAAGANASITVYLKTGTSQAAGLGPKAADSTGKVSWDWTLEPTVTPGNYRVVVSVSSGGKTAQTEATMVIQ